MVTSLRATLRSILDYRRDVEAGSNPNNLTPAQLGTYSRAEVDLQLAQLLGNGDLPISQYGDSGFSAPNVSSRYEGATTTYPVLVYQVEQDGSRNYLRCGMDGQSAGVYLCKFFVDGNDRMSGYSPMATPWRPAWLPAADTIAELIHTEQGKVAVRCIGTYNGKLPAGSSYYVVTWADNTLDPELYTEHRAFTGLSQGGLEGRYQRGFTTLWTDASSTGGFMVRFTGTDPNNGSSFEVLRLTSLDDGAILPGGIVSGFTGVDALGVTQNTPTLANLGASKTGAVAYCQYTGSITSISPYQTQPILTVLDRTGDELTLAVQHEVWAGRAGAESRKFVTRVLKLDPVARTFSVDPAYRGPLLVDSTVDGVSITGPCVNLYTTGLPYLGNINTAWSRCGRTGEVLVQSSRPSTGVGMLRYIPHGTLAEWLSPLNRDWSTQQTWSYMPNYPSPIGATLGFPVPVSAGLRVQSTVGYADLTAPGYASPIPYTYPDGFTGQWAVDTGRTLANGWIPTRTMTVVPKAGAVRHVGLAQRGGTGNISVLENGTRTGTWSVTPALDATLDADMRAYMGTNAATDHNFVCYRPGAIGHLVDPLVVIGYGLDGSSRGVGYTAVYEITSAPGNVVTTATLKVQQQALTISSTAFAARLCGTGDTTSSMIIAEGADFVCLCGSSPWEQNYIGNSGQATLAVAMQASGSKVVKAYQAHRYPNADTLYYIPGKGLCTHVIGVDSQYAMTTLTVEFAGNTYAQAGVSTGERMVIASQAVYGSWNVYFAEEVRCQINGVSGRMPKKTVALSDIQANPASTTFYMYAMLTDGVFDYLITPTQQPATRTMIFIGTVVTTASQIGSVNVKKTFSIDGFSLSQDIVAYAIPMSAGAPYSTSTVINWPNVAT